MTYRELAIEILRLKEEQMDQDVTVVTQDDEYLPIRYITVDVSGDVLDIGHYVLIA